MGGPRMTASTVKASKERKEQYPNMCHADIGTLCGVSRSTVQRVLAGELDYLLADAEAVAECSDLAEFFGAATGEDVVDQLEKLTNVCGYIGYLLASIKDKDTDDFDALAKIARQTFGASITGGER